MRGELEREGGDIDSEQKNREEKLTEKRDAGERGRQTGKERSTKYTKTDIER